MRSMFILALIFLVSSCAPKKSTSTKVKITSSFAMTSNGFTGGVIIRGSSGANIFNANILSGYSLESELPTGDWKFIVVGWDGPTSLSGSAYCGVVSQKLDRAEVTVNISLTQANCTRAEFTQIGYSSSAGTSLKPLKIFNCSSLKDNTGTIISSTTDPVAFQSSFCDENTALLDAEKQRAQYIQVKIPGEASMGRISPDIATNCLPTFGNEVQIGQLPLNSIPIMIKLSDNSDCSDSHEFIFPKGLLGAVKPLSIVNTRAGTYNALFLPYNSAAAPAQILSFTLKNSSNVNLSPNSSLVAGQAITMKVTAFDQNGLPLEYKFLKGINSSTSIISDWSSVNEVTYTIPGSDSGLGDLKIWVAVRNSDGINFNSTLFGDSYQSWNYQVPGNFSPAVISNVIVSRPDLSVIANNSVLNEGDTISIKAVASDPNGLPIEYKFLKGVGSATTILSDWSSTNEINYTIPSSDLGLSGLKIWAAVRNDDGINFNSTLFGDGTTMWNYQAPGLFSPAQLLTIIVKNQIGTVLPAGSILSPGQVITIEASATDANGLPISYKFLKGINSSTSIIQDWGSSNSATYIVPSSDMSVGGLCIWVAVRNNDGINFNSVLFGDGTQFWNYATGI